MYNGQYNPEKGRPQKMVSELRESMAAPTNMGIQYNPAARESLCEVKPRCDTWSRLDELDTAIENINQSVINLRNRLTGVLNHQEQDSNCPIPGPRASSSNLEGRICAQADFVEDLNRLVGDIIDRLTV